MTFPGGRDARSERSYCRAMLPNVALQPGPNPNSICTYIYSIYTYIYIYLQHVYVYISARCLGGAAPFPAGEMRAASAAIAAPCSRMSPSNLSTASSCACLPPPPRSSPREAREEREAGGVLAPSPPAAPRAAREAPAGGGAATASASRATSLRSASTVALRRWTVRSLWKRSAAPVSPAAEPSNPEAGPSVPEAGPSTSEDESERVSSASSSSAPVPAWPFSHARARRGAFSGLGRPEAGLLRSEAGP